MQVVRQRDKKFVALLRNIREGRIVDKDMDLLKTRMIEPDETDGIVATRLFCHNKDVDALNRAEHDKLPGEEHKFYGEGSTVSKVDESLLPNNEDWYNLRNQCGMLLKLKEGDQVMLTANIDVTSGLANGVRGTVIGFKGSLRKFPVVKFLLPTHEYVEHTVTAYERKIEDDTFVATYKQLPLQYAWALTVHKSQGSTLTKVVVSLGRAFEDGQVYVALSRATSLRSLWIESFDRSTIVARPDVVGFITKCRRGSLEYQPKRIRISPEE